MCFKMCRHQRTLSTCLSFINFFWLEKKFDIFLHSFWMTLYNLDCTLCSVWERDVSDFSKSCFTRCSIFLPSPKFLTITYQQFMSTRIAYASYDYGWDFCWDLCRLFLNYSFFWVGNDTNDATAANFWRVKFEFTMYDSLSVAFF